MSLSLFTSLLDGRKIIIAVSCLSVSAMAAEPKQLTFNDDGALPVSVVLNKGEIATRYQLSTNENGDVTKRTEQEKALLDVTIGFFKGNRVRIDLVGMTGSSFGGSFDSFGTGVGSKQDFAFHLRRVSITYTPKKGYEITTGSMAPEYGAGSEAAYLDNDGYIMGYRAKAKLTEDSQLVITSGYLGSFKNPNVFDRTGDFANINYVQAVLNQTINQLIRTSVEVDSIDGDAYLRGALKLKMDQWVKFLDTLVVEDLTRVTGGSAYAILMTLNAKFKALLGEGRDLTVALTLASQQGDLNLLIGDHTFAKTTSARIRVMAPKLIEKKGVASGALFVDFVESLEDLEKIRAEIGMIVSF